MFSRKAILVISVSLCVLFSARESEARLFRRLLGRRGPARFHQPVTVYRPVRWHHAPPHHPPHHPEPDFVQLPDFSEGGFDSADFIDANVTLSDARTFYLGLRNQLLVFGEDSPSFGLKGRCFDGSHWSSHHVVNLNLSHGRLRIGWNDFQITFRERGWIQFVRRGHWGWEHHFLRNIGNGRFQYFRRSNGGHWLRCTLDSISEVRGSLSLVNFGGFGRNLDTAGVGTAGTLGLDSVGGGGGLSTGPGNGLPLGTGDTLDVGLIK